MYEIGAPPLFSADPSVLPPKFSDSVRTPSPLNQLRGRIFSNENFVNPPQKHKILAIIVYNEAIFKEKYGHSPHFGLFSIKNADSPNPSEIPRDSPPPLDVLDIFPKLVYWGLSKAKDLTSNSSPPSPT